MNLTEDQLKAVEQRHQDACVVAGPGSGKTTVLVERYTRLVKDAGIPPHRILAITFTEKAASNMKSKLARDPAIAPQLENAYVSTVHGFCLRLIRENAILAGVDPNVAILDERQGALLQQRSLANALDELLTKRPDEAHALMRDLAEPEVNLLGIYDAIRSSGIDLAELRNYRLPPCEASLARVHETVERLRGLKAPTPLQRQKLAGLLEWNERVRACACSADVLACLAAFQIDLKGVTAEIKEAVNAIREMVAPLQAHLRARHFAPQRETLIDILVRFDRLYAARKREMSVLDFSDLESFAVGLLRDHEEVRERVRGHFRQVMMDEFQDTNQQQSRLLNLLRAPDAFYAVGDINQSIYGFRHADPEVFRGYSEAVATAGKHHVTLLENWRSRPEILLAAETILYQAPGIEQHRLIARREFTAKKAPSIEVIAVDPDDNADPLALEAQWVAHKMIELRGILGFEFGDMALLVRNSSAFEAFAAAFDAANVEYDLNRRRGFFETREARDLTHLLHVIANPRDEISTVAVLRSPVVAISDEALFRLELIDKNMGAALDRFEEAPLDPVDRDKLRHFRVSLARWRAAQPYLTHDRLLVRAMDESGYRWDPASRAGANIEKFLELARNSIAPLAQFIEELALMRDFDAREADTPLDETRNAVHMMTAHSAKGLEFPVVFVATMHKGVDTDRSAFSFTPLYGLGVGWRGIPGGKADDDAFHRANKIEMERKDKEEANRLLYVAMTRAEEHLVLSYSRKKNKPSEWAKLVDPLFPEAGDQTIDTPFGKTLKVRVARPNAPPPLGQLPFDFEEPPHSAFLARPEIAGQHDSAVSVTSLALFQACPRKYYLSRYLGFEEGRRQKLSDILPEEETPLAASDLGVQVHALLAGETVADPDPLAIRLARVFTASELGRRAANATHIEREFDFLLASDDVVVSGKIDLWFEEGGELILVDYKTDTIEDAEAYALQLQFYALTLERLTGRLPDRAYIHFLRSNTVVPVAIGTSNAAAAVRALAQAQDDLHFPLNEGEHCQRCKFYRGLCPAA